MRLVSIKDFDVINSTNISVSVWCGFCPIKCEGCHNSDYWSKDSGIEFEQKHMDIILQKLNEGVDKNLSMLGGEPLVYLNYPQVRNICATVKRMYPHKQIMLWTGYDFDTVKDREIMEYIDILIDGKYDQTQKEKNSRFKGSSNQRIIDVQKSLKENRIIEIEL